ncbi:riboflavin biosynthesis protein RibD [Terrihabitans soli]|uniref:Riboflavin biosynthesis protein RibD n=1 Tax=Terrihabitans soli TaxID=708113 RepID=A0A6S6QML8_9HYPH|nr:bifunctional diaminohydroxyphosphoribosylaminopyrimidine deaminase/5-amino-6-(5-phosphoribosylamino)uracil reductase RibD [Terrihabitans soli]BCJ90626.1 riboflavin biosynthesis protein RibD [Terrihabitans soli]
MTIATAAHNPVEAGSDDDARYMLAALRLGERELGRTWPNPSVGAILVKDGIVVGRGWTKTGGRPHAETVAIQEAGDQARGATLYVSLEPCSHQGRTPPCANAIIAAGISRVVSAMEDPNPLVAGQGHKRLRDAGIEVVENVLRDEAVRVHAGHISRIARKRPYVTLKLALSSNGKAGLSGRRPAPITGEKARDLVHLMRSRTDAIAAGIGTVVADDPLLTCRLPGMEDRSPLRVIFDSSLRLPLASHIVTTAREVPVWVIAEQGASPDNERSLAPHGIEVIRAPLTEEGGDLIVALHILSERGIGRLMVEGGPAVAAQFLKKDLIDQAVIFQSPDPLPDDGIEGLPAPHQKLFPEAGLNLRSRHDAGGDTMFLYERD